MSKKDIEGGNSSPEPQVPEQQIAEGAGADSPEPQVPSSEQPITEGVGTDSPEQYEFPIVTAIQDGIKVKIGELQKRIEALEKNREDWDRLKEGDLGAFQEIFTNATRSDDPVGDYHEEYDENFPERELGGLLEAINSGKIGMADIENIKDERLKVFVEFACTYGDKFIWIPPFVYLLTREDGLESLKVWIEAKDICLRGIDYFDGFERVLDERGAQGGRALLTGESMFYPEDEEDTLANFLHFVDVLIKTRPGALLVPDGTGVIWDCSIIKERQMRRREEEERAMYEHARPALDRLMSGELFGTSPESLAPGPDGTEVILDDSMIEERRDMLGGVDEGWSVRELPESHDDRFSIGFKPSPKDPAPEPDSQEAGVEPKQTATEKELSPEQIEFMGVLKTRYEKNKHNIPCHSVEWSKVEVKLRNNPGKLNALKKMENTGGEPDVYKVDGDDFIFGDLSSSAPEGRRDVDYPQAVKRASEMGGLMHPDDYLMIGNELGIKMDNVPEGVWLDSAHRQDLIDGGEALMGDRDNGGIYVRPCDALFSSIVCAFRCSLRV